MRVRPRPYDTAESSGIRLVLRWSKYEPNFSVHSVYSRRAAARRLRRRRAACGHRGSGTAPPRGTLLQSPPELLSTMTAASLLLELNLATNLQLLTLSGAPVCDILMYHIQYATVGGANEATTASAALMVPSGLARTAPERARSSCMRMARRRTARSPWRTAECGDSVPGGDLRVAGLYRRGAELRGL